MGRRGGERGGATPTLPIAHEHVKEKASIVKKIEEVEEKQANDAGMQAAALSSVTVVSRMRGVFCFFAMASYAAFTSLSLRDACSKKHLL